MMIEPNSIEFQHNGTASYDGKAVAERLDKLSRLLSDSMSQAADHSTRNRNVNWARNNNTITVNFKNDNDGKYSANALLAFLDEEKNAELYDKNADLKKENTRIDVDTVLFGDVKVIAKTEPLKRNIKVSFIFPNSSPQSLATSYKKMGLHLDIRLENLTKEKEKREEALEIEHERTNPIMAGRKVLDYIKEKMQEIGGQDKYHNRSPLPSSVEECASTDGTYRFSTSLEFKEPIDPERVNAILQATRFFPKVISDANLEVALNGSEKQLLATLKTLNKNLGSPEHISVSRYEKKEEITTHNGADDPRVVDIIVKGKPHLLKDNIERNDTSSYRAMIQKQKEEAKRGPIWARH